MEDVFCVNCGSASGSMFLEDEHTFHCVQRWIAPLLVQTSDVICTTCWSTAQKEISTTSASLIGRNCALCNNNLAPRTRSHQVIALRTDTKHHVNIRNIVIERLAPLKVRASHFICHPCWQRVDRAARHYSEPSSSSAVQTTRNHLSCVSCGINLIRQRQHLLNNIAILLQVQQQVAPVVVTADDYICDVCNTVFLVNSASRTSQGLPDTTHIGHHYICLGCGVSLARTQRYSLGAEGSLHILDVVRIWIQPREVD